MISTSVKFISTYRIVGCITFSLDFPLHLLSHLWNFFFFFCSSSICRTFTLSADGKLIVKVHLKLRYSSHATFALLSWYPVFVENSLRRTVTLSTSMKRLLRRRIFVTADEQFRLLRRNVKNESNQVCQLLVPLRYTFLIHLQGLNAGD